MVTLPPPYRNLKDVSAHQRPQQRPVSLDHGTEGVRLPISSVSMRTLSSRRPVIPDCSKPVSVTRESVMRRRSWGVALLMQGSVARMMGVVNGEPPDDRRAGGRAMGVLGQPRSQPYSQGRTSRVPPWPAPH